MVNILIVAAPEATHVTHAGVFHADEVMSTAILVLLARRNHNTVKLARVSAIDASVNPAALVYDIGHGAFDHHQQGGGGVRDNGVPYSSCGLIWREFGHQLVSNEKVWSAIDAALIQGIDALDNGEYPHVDYPATATTVSDLISAFNPVWDCKAPDYDRAFLRAVSFALRVLRREIATHEAIARAQIIVERAIARSDGEVIVLKRRVPWAEIVLNSTQAKAQSAAFVVSPDLRGGWMVQAIPSDPADPFSMRKSLPTTLGGLEPTQLAATSGIDDLTFVHPKLFCGSAASLAGAIALAKLGCR